MKYILPAAALLFLSCLHSSQAEHCPKDIYDPTPDQIVEALVKQGEAFPSFQVMGVVLALKGRLAARIEELNQILKEKRNLTQDQLIELRDLSSRFGQARAILNFSEANFKYPETKRPRETALGRRYSTLEQLTADIQRLQNPQKRHQYHSLIDALDELGDYWVNLSTQKIDPQSRQTALSKARQARLEARRVERILYDTLLNPSPLPGIISSYPLLLQLAHPGLTVVQDLKPYSVSLQAYFVELEARIPVLTREYQHGVLFGVRPMERINDFLEWISRERAALAGLSAEAQATPAYHSGISVQVIDELVAAADQARATIQLELENVQRESARLTDNGASYNAEGTVDYLLGTANEWDGRSIGNRPPDGYRVRIQNALLAYKGARARLTQFNLQ